MARYHLYHRVSKKGQAEEGQGVERQLIATEEWIVHHNQTLQRPYIKGFTYTDSGRSGYTKENFNRGRLGELFKDIEGGKIQEGDIIVMELIDRFSRASSTFVRKKLQEILDKDISVAFTKWNVVFSNQLEGMEGVSARLMLEIGMHLANEESNQKSMRISASKELLKGQGIIVDGKTPIWLNISQDRKGYEIVEENAEIIRRIFELRIQGKGATKIINDLGNVKLKRYKYNDDGELVISKVNKPLSQSAINTYLRNKDVIGNERKPPIVSESIYYSCQSKLKSSSGGRTSTTFKNVFQGIVQCAKCGYAMAYDQGRLVCNNRRKNKACDTPRINLQEAQNALYTTLSNLEHNEEKVVDIAALEQKILALEKQQSNILDFVQKLPDSDNEVPLERYKQISSELVQERQVLEESKAALSGDINTLDFDLTTEDGKQAFNQLLKDYKVSVRLGEDYIGITIGWWNNFTTASSILSPLDGEFVAEAHEIGFIGVGSE